jgi:hypothetical protein
LLQVCCSHQAISKSRGLALTPDPSPIAMGEGSIAPQRRHGITFPEVLPLPLRWERGALLPLSCRSGRGGRGVRADIDMHRDTGGDGPCYNDDTITADRKMYI